MHGVGDFFKIISDVNYLDHRDSGSSRVFQGNLCVYLKNFASRHASRSLLYSLACTGYLTMQRGNYFKGEECS